MTRLPEQSPRGHNNYPQWELAVREANDKMDRARAKQTVLRRYNLEDSKRFFIRSGANDVVPASHVRISLVLPVRYQAIDGVVELVVRRPVMPIEDAPQICIREFLNRHRTKQIEDLDEVPTRDVFVEAKKDTGEVSRFLLSPGTEGFIAYDDARDILPSPPDYQVLGQVFEVSADAAAFPDARIDMHSFLRMLYDYEPSLQGNERPSAQSA